MVNPRYSVQVSADGRVDNIPMIGYTAALECLQIRPSQKIHASKAPWFSVGAGRAFFGADSARGDGGFASHRDEPDPIRSKRTRTRRLNECDTRSMPCDRLARTNQAMRQIQTNSPPPERWRSSRLGERTRRAQPAVDPCGRIRGSQPDPIEPELIRNRPDTECAPTNPNGKLDPNEPELRRNPDTQSARADPNEPSPVALLGI
jgi:hypothetical protein